MLTELRRNEAARFIAHAALKAGRDPLRELGLADAPLTVGSAALLFELLMEREEEEMTGSEVEEDTQAVIDQMDRDDAWDAATGAAEDGYEGERGVTPPGSAPALPPLRDPEADDAPRAVWRPWPWTVRGSHFAAHAHPAAGASVDG